MGSLRRETLSVSFCIPCQERERLHCYRKRNIDDGEVGRRHIDRRGHPDIDELRREEELEANQNTREVTEEIKRKKRRSA